MRALVRSLQFAGLVSCVLTAGCNAAEDGAGSPEHGGRGVSGSTDVRAAQSALTSDGTAPAAATSDASSATQVTLPSDSVTLTAVQDATILSSQPNKNFGTTATLDFNRTLVQFDLSSIVLGATDYISSAQLQLTLTNDAQRGAGASYSVNANRVTSAWTEAGATWNCAVDSNPANSSQDCSGSARWSMAATPGPWANPATANVSVAPSQTGVVTFDLSTDVRGFVKGTFANYGWLLRSSPTSELTAFASRQSSTPPRLIVTIRRCTQAACDDHNVCTADSCSATATCLYSNIANGTSCNDGNACTQTDVCQGGTCTGKSPKKCPATDDCHSAGSCDPGTGQCSNPNAPEGTSCNDHNVCTSVDWCQAGVCTGKTNAADGKSCNDSSACTKKDACQAGVCTGVPAVTCGAGDQCHAAGVCDPSTGTCANAALPDGTSCSDGNACTQGDSCQAGVCSVGNPVTCSASDQCHVAGTCVPSTGACSNPVAPDGTSCDDGSASTAHDACNHGVCGGVDLCAGVTCSASDQCHMAGTCDPNTGACSNPAKANGTSCSDANACTQGDACQAGVCSGGNPVTCSASDACHPATCNPTSGTCTVVAACALYGVGTIPGTGVDGLAVSPAVLEDGANNNQTSAFGSALTYTGSGNLYIGTPDRGPNNGGDSYTDRYYLIDLSLAGGVVTPQLVGAATLNQAPGVAFTGHNTAFDATNSPASLRLDPEGVRVSPLGTFYVSDEYGPFLYEFDANGDRIRALHVPSEFLIDHPAVEAAELPPGNTKGRQSNRGMEGLAITPDGSKLYGIMQNALIQDGALDSANKRIGKNNRILEINPTSGATRELLYQIDDKNYGVNEMVAVNDHQFLVIERDGNAGSAAAFKRLYLIDTSSASDISGIASLPSTGTPAGITPVQKTPFLDLLRTEYGLAGASFPEKIEGLAFGPDLPDGRHVLVVTNDNDGITTQNNNFYVFAIDPSVLPGYVAQQATFDNLCAGVTCAAPDACHLAGICNPGTGACSYASAPAGTAAGTQVAGDCQRTQCDGAGQLVSIADDADLPVDGNDCTEDVCTSGVPSNPALPAGSACSQQGGSECDGAASCVSCLLPSECPGADSECMTRTCTSGSCGKYFAPEGTPSAPQLAGDCDLAQCDGAGTIEFVADNGDLPPDDGDVCTAEVCVTGLPAHPPAPDGTLCNDGSLCTQIDACLAGTCIGQSPVTCSASDQCHIAGSCDPATGACSSPAIADGTACADNDACTQGDACLAGACIPGPAVACVALDQCHVAGSCDPATGVCSNPASADGSACNDGNACTTDACFAGACSGSAIACAATDACHSAGVCDPNSGACSNPEITGCRIVSGTVVGSYFTPATSSVRASSAPSTYAGVKVCVDANDDLACNAGENSATTDAFGGFQLLGVQAGAIIAEIATSALNGGHAITQRLVMRAQPDQIAEGIANPSETPFIHSTLVVSPLSTEVARMMEADAIDYATAKSQLATRLGISLAQLLIDPATIADPAAQRAWLNEVTILGNRFGLAARMVDRGDVSPSALAADPNATSPAIAMKEAQKACMNLEGIPRYDHLFIIVLENREAVTIKNNAFAPNINAYLNSGNQFTSYYATGNPSEPNRVAITAGDDFGITDDSAWNCVDKAANNPEDPLPAGMSACSNATNHNIKNRPNLLNAMSSGGMLWRVYSETMNPGRDPRRDGAADATLIGQDHVYPASSPVGAIGNASILIPLPAQAYATKHNESVNFQGVRSAPEFFDSNRTLGGSQWDAAIVASPSTPAGWNVDQFGSDLVSGDLANLNYLEPDQCDDMHGLTLQGKLNGTGSNVNASDCSGNALIYRSDLYTDWLIKKIKASPVWANPYKRSAIVIMFDEGTVTTGTISCCGWNPGGKSSGPLVLSGGATALDTSVANYKNGNKGHSYSIYGVLTNQAVAPKGLYDSDAYSHISLVRTLEDMFQLADPGDNWSYMNRSKYTQSFITANILFLPEYAGSADPHFDAVRPMNHAYVIPAGYTQRNGYPTSAAKQVGPDLTQTNLWGLKP